MEGGGGGGGWAGFYVVASYESSLHILKFEMAADPI